MKRKIVITGISSSMMTKLAQQIDASKYEIVGITRNPASVFLQNVTIVKGDLLDIDAFAHVFKGCYMIIHGAAITHSRNKEEYFKINLEATRRLVELSKKNGVSHFAFISSNTAGNDSGAYGKSKLLAEQAVRENLSNWTIIRPSEIYGGGKSEGIEKLIDDVLHKSFVLCPTGVPTKLYPIHVDEAIQQMHHHILHANQNMIQTINGPEGYSYLEVIRLIEKISKRKVKVIFLNRRVMFFIKKIVELSPVNLGIVPDQIDRLYSVKRIDSNSPSSMRLETYVEQLVRKNG